MLYYYSQVVNYGGMEGESEGTTTAAAAAAAFPSHPLVERKNEERSPMPTGQTQISFNFTKHGKEGKHSSSFQKNL